ncbi:MAG: hypothetical protein ACKVS8_00515 [Phycisphaerales bacterium]
MFKFGTPMPFRGASRGEWRFAKLYDIVVALGFVSIGAWSWHAHGLHQYGWVFVFPMIGIGAWVLLFYGRLALRAYRMRKRCRVRSGTNPP